MSESPLPGEPEARSESAAEPDEIPEPALDLDVRSVDTPATRDLQVEADSYLTRLTDGLTSAESALALAVLVNRAATRLHNAARGDATQHKGGPDWPAWAQLQNASRNLVLQASTCRDLAARLAGRRR